MLLPDHEIVAAVESGHLGIDPWDPTLVQPASVDVRLGDSFLGRTWRANGFEWSGRDTITWMPAGEWRDDPHFGPLDLLPGQFILGHTIETVRVPADLAVRVEGKSSWARRGLLTHVTAGFVDPGFEGQITLELSNLSQETIRLTPGQPIGQLCMYRMSSRAARPYGSAGLGSKYQGQAGPTAARTPPVEGLAA